MFEIVQPGPKDFMFELKKRADKDFSPEKIDLGVGIYRNELGGCHELRCVTEVSIVREEEMRCGSEIHDCCRPSKSSSRLSRITT
jgi:aspartate/tyrosine/aromatic aminotransferase